MVGYVITAAVVAVLVVVHEHGHLLAGLAVGIPRSAMKIEYGFPISRLLLSDEQGLIAPWDEARYRRSAPSPRSDVLVTAGGLILQTAVVVVVCGALASFEATRRLAERVVWASLIMLAGYLIIDIVWTWRSGQPEGDYSLFWRQSRTIAAVCLAATAVAHVVVVVLLG